MPRLLQPDVIALDAAFALFEAMRGMTALPLDREEAGGSVTCLGTVDATAAHLGFTADGDPALRFAWTHDGQADALWVHAHADGTGARLATYVGQDRPVCQVRLAAPHFKPVGPDRWLLTVPLAFSSHDGRHAWRQAHVRFLAGRRDVPMPKDRLVVGHWDALEKSWDADAGRRWLAIAVLLAEVASESTHG